MLYLPSVEEHTESSTSCSSSPPTHSLSTVSNGRAEPCTQCQQPIHDRFLLILENQAFHPNCLRCSYCFGDLGQDSGCHVKDGMVICRSCYPVKYRRACLKCGLVLLSEDLIMRAKDTIFHLNCFTCCICGTQLSAGETFTMNGPDLFCQLHTQLNLAAVDNVVSHRSEDSEEHEEEQQPQNRSKRMRTSFKHHQLKAMKLYFTLNHNPDAKDLKQLAQKTGLTKRVLQVWFQNARAKYRRSMQGRDGHGLSLSGAIVEPTTLTVIQRQGDFGTSSPKYEPDSPK